MAWRASAYDHESSVAKANADLAGYDSLCRWIRERVNEDASVVIHVVAPYDATSEQLSELRRAGVRVSFAN